MSTPLEEFFAQYPNFDYHSASPATSEFRRLSRSQKWGGQHNEEREAAHSEFRTALVRQFNHLYGTDANDLEAWKYICEMVRIDPIPKTVSAAKKAMRDTHVNLIDLIGAPNGGDMEIFASEKELSEYTRETRRFFPKEALEAGNLLKSLRRQIFRPRGRS
ncbi:hypothetical protein FA15DRAFT_64489 [Coprinopsis marcescibilis]|uniref:Uncharacterized protein n=1 Tax=Coprinopsis marcescibilis TaxID=230819 RepID=A0A5C3KN22_COPMA|nr:hypothetical protein FA15DRAFT_64489 [Coprinopsis marcescibilis]